MYFRESLTLQRVVQILNMLVHTPSAEGNIGVRASLPQRDLPSEPRAMTFISDGRCSIQTIFLQLLGKYPRSGIILLAEATSRMTVRVQRLRCTLHPPMKVSMPHIGISGTMATRRRGTPGIRTWGN